MMRFSAQYWLAAVLLVTTGQVASAASSSARIVVTLPDGTPAAGAIVEVNGCSGDGPANFDMPAQWSQVPSPQPGLFACAPATITNAQGEATLSWMNADSRAQVGTATAVALIRHAAARAVLVGIHPQLPPLKVQLPKSSRLTVQVKCTEPCQTELEVHARMLRGAVHSRAAWGPTTGTTSAVFADLPALAQLMVSALLTDSLGRRWSHLQVLPESAANTSFQMPATTGSYQVQVTIKNAPAANISASCRVGDWKLMIPGITVTAAADATLLGLIGECEITASHNPRHSFALRTTTRSVRGPGLAILQFK